MHRGPAQQCPGTQCSCTSSWQHQDCSMGLPLGCCATCMFLTQVLEHCWWQGTAACARARAMESMPNRRSALQDPCLSSEGIRCMEASGKQQRTRFQRACSA